MCAMATCMTNKLQNLEKRVRMSTQRCFVRCWPESMLLLLPHYLRFCPVHRCPILAEPEPGLTWKKRSSPSRARNGAGGQQLCAHTTILAPL